MSLLAAYKENSVTTQSGERLVVMLYDGAIRFLKLALNAMSQNDFEAKGKYIAKAQDVISELNVVLDMDAGGEIASNLRSLYLFMNSHLSQANTNCDQKKIQDVIDLLEELNQSWKAIAQ